MPALQENAITLLGTKTGVDMKTVASTTIFTTKSTKVCRITHVVIRDPSATLAGGTSYNFTNWKQAVDLSSMTTANTDYMVLDSNNTKFQELAASTAFQISVVTGSTGAATAVIDVFGYYTD